jgi:hypothetical protein
LEGLAGAGTAGDLIGVTTGSFSTITPTSPTAEFSSTATTSIAPVDFTTVESTELVFPAREVSAGRSMDSLALVQERSAVSIMEEWQEASPFAGSRALAEDSMVVVSTEVEAFTEEAAVAGNSEQLL